MYQYLPYKYTTDLVFASKLRLNIHKDFSPSGGTKAQTVHNTETRSFLIAQYM